MSPEYYLHGHSESVLRAHGARTVEDSCGYLLDALRPGLSVLDLGCGPGTITAGIAARVAPGRVLAVDADPGVLAAAEAFAAQEEVANIEFARMDAYHLDVPDGAVDLAHAHQVLQHLADPVAALRELARVTRPTGEVAVRDADYSAFTWYPAHPGLDDWRELYLAAARAGGGEPDAGRHLLAWAHAAGFTEVAASSSTWTYAGAGAAWWADLWSRRVLDSAFASRVIDLQLATRQDLEALSAAWLEWSSSPDAWLMIPHGELRARP